MSFVSIVDSKPRFRPLVVAAALVVSVIALTAVSAQWYIPLWPVPVTGQTLVVLLGGAALGWRAGALAQLLYLLVGALGMPVFAEATGGVSPLFGPMATTAGYLFSFPLAAALVGRLTENRDRGFWSTLGVFVAGSGVIYAGGIIGLMVVLDIGLVEALGVGVVPFLVGDALKVILGTTIWHGSRVLVGDYQVG